MASLILQAALSLLLAAPPGSISPEAEAGLWRQVLHEVRVNERLPPRQPVVVGPKTYFPRHLTDEIAATLPDPREGQGDCAMDPGRWEGLIRRLSAANRSRRSVRRALGNETQLVFGTRAEHEDFIGLSRVHLFDSGRRAMLSVSISNLAGAILLYEKTTVGWDHVSECVEWASY